MLVDINAFKAYGNIAGGQIALKKDFESANAHELSII